MRVDFIVKAIFAFCITMIVGWFIVMLIATANVIKEVKNEGGLPTVLGNWVQEFEEARTN